MPRPGEVMVGGRSRTSARLALGCGALAVLAMAWFAAGRPGLGTEAAGDAGGATPAAEQSDAPADVARAFLDAWAAEDWDALQELTADPSLDAGGEHARAHGTLGVEATRITAGEAVADDDRVVVPYEVTWDLGDLGEATFTSELAVVGEDGRRRVRWWYPVLHPDLEAGRRFERVRAWPARAPILDAAGQPLVEHVGEVVVGVLPGRMVEGPEPVVEALAAHTDVDAAEAEAVLGRDDLDPQGFYPLVALDELAFAEVRDALLPVPGIVTRDGVARTPEDTGVLAPLLGRLGEVTGELLEELGPPYRPGDTVGRSGLERAHERRLAGEPALEARIVEGSGLVTTLAYVAGAEPEPLETTLDEAVQTAAVEALVGAPEPAALVAVDAPTGEVRAAAWTGDQPIALTGRYPPGSTFKTVSAAALLAAGADPDTRIDCPGDLRLGGRSFTNAGDYGPGEIDLLEAFGRSCNTAFAAAMVDAGADDLAAAASWFGFGDDYGAGLPAFGGSFPAPEDAAELAAAGIGQGRVEASPLHMASVAAAARTGTWRAPHLVRGGEVPNHDLPPGVVAPLDALMREVVTTGTGTAAAVDGEPPVAGKTGSAEFGDGERTHAWFIGYRGDLAFAVLVEGGGAGGGVAAPLAAQFLSALD